MSLPPVHCGHQDAGLCAACHTASLQEAPEPGVFRGDSTETPLDVQPWFRPGEARLWWDAYLAFATWGYQPKAAGQLADVTIELVRERKLLFEPTDAKSR